MNLAGRREIVYLSIAMSSTIPYGLHLNVPQLEAVTHIGSPLLVLAGAGSGKTRVITYKIAHLIHECGLSPRNILAVTFTNKAAGEMKERVESLLGGPAEIWVKTFHSAAARLLRIMGGQFGVRQGFTIIDKQDQLSLMKKIMKTLNADPEVYKPEKYSHLIERAKDNLLDLAGAQKNGFSSDPLFYEIYRLYEEKLERENLFDFGDLIARLSRGLAQSQGALLQLKNRFRYVLVDEFQDTNYAQYALVKQLTLPEGNICVVGDDDQSIYGFRGAKVENILNFSRDYRDTKIVKLEENYRSFQTILSASSRVIGNNPDRLGKTLYTHKGKGDKIVFFRAASDYGEAQYIAEEIRDQVNGTGCRFSDFAVFYRMNAQSRVFESVFTQERIPYTIVGGLRFYEREEIKDTLAYLRLALNPLDEVSLRRIANKPPRGVGEKTVDALVRSTIDRGFPPFGGGAHPEVSPAKAQQVDAFLAALTELSRVVQSDQPPVVLKHLYDTSGYIEWLRKEGKEEKLKNLDELYNAVEEFSKKNPDSTLADFLEEASLNQGGGEEGSPVDRVFLITLHNAKGLEFPVVFMAGMEEGIFPHFLSGEKREDLQEERRLCYVGMTRAMDRLYLTAARVRKLYGRSVDRGVSAFIFEVPKELLEWKEDRRLGSGLFDDFEPGLKPWSSQTGGSARREAGRGGGRGAGLPRLREGSTAHLDANCRVVHKSFGSGKVVATDGEIAEIQFDDGKKMKFMLKYTPLLKE